MHLHDWSLWSAAVEYGQVTLSGYPILYQTKTCHKCGKIKSRKIY